MVLGDERIEWSATETQLMAKVTMEVGGNGYGGIGFLFRFLYPNANCYKVLIQLENINSQRETLSWFGKLHQATKFSNTSEEKMRLHLFQEWNPKLQTQL